MTTAFSTAISAEQILIGMMLDDDYITSKVGTKIFPGRIPLKDETDEVIMPCITVRREGGVGSAVRTPDDKANMHVVCWSRESILRAAEIYEFKDGSGIIRGVNGLLHQKENFKHEDTKIYLITRTMGPDTEYDPDFLLWRIDVWYEVWFMAK